MAKKLNVAAEAAVTLVVKNAIVAFQNNDDEARLKIGDIPISAHNLPISTDDFEETESRNGTTYWATPNKWEVTLEISATGRVIATGGKETDEPSRASKKLVFTKKGKKPSNDDVDA